ncbi:BspA family leucine-rich repeat surface protein [Acinetobacter sp. MB5]|uniref:BspA family leucine-rich repeat surface protein n=1 Tax=Acinetobacter sp. MB5 TaxID=2069438 RepID=UPI000DD0B2D7|nr:BspA family leucine-rich repeat surface protein [Acinetobacter sp. MB5]
MTNLIGKKLWSDVRVLESYEYAQGGENGNMNEQAKALVNRTEYLRGMLQDMQQVQQNQQDWQLQVTEQLAQLGLQFNQLKAQLDALSSGTDLEQPTDPETPTDPEPVYPASAMVLRSSDQVSEVTLELDKGTHQIDWGDGTSDSEVNGEIIHHYATPAQYSIVVEKTSDEGGSNGNNTMVMTVALGIQEVVQWYEQGYEVLGFALNTSSLQDTLIKVPATAPLVFATANNPIFMRCSAFNDPNILQWDVSSYTDLAQWFQECHAFNQPIGTWDFSNKTSLASMFYNCSSFNQDLGMINVAKVSNMQNMFYGCTQFNQDLSQWCVSQLNASSMDDVFAYGSALTPEHYPVWGTCPRGENQYSAA